MESLCSVIQLWCLSDGFSCLNIMARVFLDGWEPGVHVCPGFKKPFFFCIKNSHVKDLGNSFIANQGEGSDCLCREAHLRTSRVCTKIQVLKALA